MSSVILLLVIVIASLLCVRIGAIALELTGMERDKARFQALSAFTNTGFTTAETEEITHFPIRRRIVTVLIILGHAGTISVIATFASSLLQSKPIYSVVNFGIIIIALYGIYRLTRWQGLALRIQWYFRDLLTTRYGLSRPSLEEMLKVGEGFGVVRFVIEEGLPFVERHLAELNLKEKKVQILSITRNDRTITIPQGNDVLRVGDTVICYGDVQAATQIFNVHNHASGSDNGKV